MSGTIVNVCVYSVTKKINSAAWTIVSVADKQHSFGDFFVSNIEPRIAGSSETSYDVESALIGPCKDRLDRVDLGLHVYQVVDNFGCFLKYAVTDTALNSSPATSVSLRGRGNAFEILIISFTPNTS